MEAGQGLQRGVLESWFHVREGGYFYAAWLDSEPEKGRACVSLVSGLPARAEVRYAVGPSACLPKDWLVPGPALAVTSVRPGLGHA